MDVLLKYLSNPEHEWPKRCEYHKILGYKSSQAVYRVLSPNDLRNIEAEALANRRARYARSLAEVDRAVLRRAAGDGRTAAADAKLAYQRLEGWEPGERLSIQGQTVIEIVTRFEISQGQEPKAITEAVTMPLPALEPDKVGSEELPDP